MALRIIPFMYIARERGRMQTTVNNISGLVVRIISLMTFVLVLAMMALSSSGEEVDAVVEGISFLMMVALALVVIRNLLTRNSQGILWRVRHYIIDQDGTYDIAAFTTAQFALSQWMAIEYGTVKPALEIFSERFDGTLVAYILIGIFAALSVLLIVQRGRVSLLVFTAFMFALYVAIIFAETVTGNISIIAWTAIGYLSQGALYQITVVVLVWWMNKSERALITSRQQKKLLQTENERLRAERDNLLAINSQMKIGTQRLEVHAGKTMLEVRTNGNNTPRTQ